MTKTTAAGPPLSDIVALIPGHRQHNSQYRSIRSARQSLEPSAVRFNDRAANRKTQPHTTRFGGKERFEDTVTIARVDAWTGVFHGDADMIVIARPHPYSQRTW